MNILFGARIKNENDSIKDQIIKASLKDGDYQIIKKSSGQKLIIHSSEKRAKKDEHNRKRGLSRLENRIKSGKLTKSNINNRGYNKYLKLEGEINISINYNKFEQDKTP